MFLGHFAVLRRRDCGAMTMTSRPESSKMPQFASKTRICRLNIVAIVQGFTKYQKCFASSRADSSTLLLIAPRIWLNHDPASLSTQFAQLRYPARRSRHDMNDHCLHLVLETCCHQNVENPGARSCCWKVFAKSDAPSVGPAWHPKWCTQRPWFCLWTGESCLCFCGFV